MESPRGGARSVRASFLSAAPLRRRSHHEQLRPRAAPTRTIPEASAIDAGADPDAVHADGVGG